MKNIYKKSLIPLIVLLLVIGIFVAIMTMFFDQAVFVRRGTFYNAKLTDKIVALTFDDGPSPIWTPKILDELKKEGVKATFFMLGAHVEQYPDIAKRISEEGHDIGNHSFSHHVLIYYKMHELEKEIRDAERVIKNVTGRTTVLFRPPKAWLTNQEKIKIKELGYKIILWSLNSKDWVHFDHRYIVRYIIKHARPGDIILLHDSGGAFTAEGGNRSRTVKIIPLLIKKLRKKGYRFVTVTELIKMANGNENYNALIK